MKTVAIEWKISLGKGKESSGLIVDDDFPSFRHHLRAFNEFSPSLRIASHMVFIQDGDQIALQVSLTSKNREKLSY